MCNHAAYALGDITAGVIASTLLPAATEEVTRVIETFAQVNKQIVARPDVLHAVVTGCITCTQGDADCRIELSFTTTCVLCVYNAQMLPPRADDSILTTSIQPAVVESMGNIGSALTAKLSFLTQSDAPPVTSASGSGSVQSVAVAAENSAVLQNQWGALHTALVAVMRTATTADPAAAAVSRRLVGVAGHLKGVELSEEEMA